MVDVARVAGVSHVTVSRVLNGHPSVKPETRDRVNAAIEVLGYRRNSVARALKTRRSSTLGVTLEGSMLFELPQILLGIETAAGEAGYSLDLAGRQTHMRSNTELDSTISDSDMQTLRNLHFRDYGEHGAFPVFSGK